MAAARSRLSCPVRPRDRAAVAPVSRPRRRALTSPLRADIGARACRAGAADRSRRHASSTSTCAGVKQLLPRGNVPGSGGRDSAPLSSTPGTHFKEKEIASRLANRETKGEHQT